jgi:hypothetical protein
VSSPGILTLEHHVSLKIEMCLWLLLRIQSSIDDHPKTNTRSSAENDKFASPARNIIRDI